MPPRRPRRLSSFSYTGRYSYFTTFCTYERRIPFTSDERVDCVRSEILRTCTERLFAVPAGVIMPDHVHLLIEGLDDKSHFKSSMKVARQRSAHAFQDRFGERLWQVGYFEHIIRDADDAAERIRYIRENPVKAGLCERPDDYPYSWWPGRPWNPLEVRGDARRNVRSNLRSDVRSDIRSAEL
jgi:REP element-mobilizing transposase RayT